MWTYVHPDPMAVKFGSYLRRKYKSTYCYIYMLTTKSLLVLDRSYQARTRPLTSYLCGSSAQTERHGTLPTPCGDYLTGCGMAGAPTLQRSRTACWPQCASVCRPLSRGDQARDYLTSPWWLLPILGGFRGPVRADYPANHLWPRVYDTPLAALLTKMMRESNRVFALRKSRHFDRFYDQIRLYLTYPPARSLVSLCTQVPSTEATGS